MCPEVVPRRYCPIKLTCRRQVVSLKKLRVDLDIDALHHNAATYMSASPSARRQWPSKTIMYKDSLNQPHLGDLEPRIVRTEMSCRGSRNYTWERVYLAQKTCGLTNG